jgi:hypothetical protein
MRMRNRRTDNERVRSFPGSTCERTRLAWTKHIAALIALSVLGMLEPALGAEENFPFTVSWDDSAAVAFSMTERLRDAPAGKHGWIRADGDLLVFEDGTPARLWGIGMSASPEFPPADKATASALVRKLSKYGFNVVRIRGIDAPTVGLYRPWARTGRLDDAVMDRIDFFVSELRKAGIYYSLGINVTSLRYAEGGSADQAQYRQAFKRYNGVQLFDEKLVTDTLRWYEAILKHANPYTKTTYAQDKAFAFVPAVAEDSIFHTYFSERDSLGEVNEKALQKRFNDYLAARYGSRDELADAWREEGRRGLSDGEDPGKGTVAIVPWKERSGASRARMRDLMRFLYSVDLDYVRRIRETLQAAGYGGLFTGTNNWFGLGNLLASHEAGTYIDTQAYFDPPALNAAGEENALESIGNVSLLAGDRGEPRRSVYHGNFYRVFRSALEDRPLIVTEWNHSAWSDYAYEGPLLLTAYASMQGYRGMLIHTYFSRRIGIRAEHGDGALVWTGNAVLIALTPTLSLAFRRGDIAESTDTIVVPIGDDENGLMDLAAVNGEEPVLGDGRVPFDAGFVHKLRIRVPGGAVADDDPGPNVAPAGDLKSSTGEILWHRGDDARLQINTRRFQAVAGDLGAGEVALANVGVQLDDTGAVTAISLDGEDLAESRSILVTAVSSFENSGASIELNKNRRGARKVVKDTGSAPMLLKRVRGQFTLRTSLEQMPRVHALQASGERAEVSVQEADASGDMRGYRFELGSADSPWYVIEF